MISWRADGRSFFYWRRPKASADTPPADWYKNSAAYLHTLGDDPDVEVPVISARTSGLGLQAHDIPWITTNPGTRWVVATAMRNVSETSFFAASRATVKPGSTRWRRVARADDKVVSVLARANRLYALTFADAPNYRIVSFDADLEPSPRLRTSWRRARSCLSTWATNPIRLILLRVESDAGHSIGSTQTQKGRNSPISTPSLSGKVDFRSSRCVLPNDAAVIRQGRA